MAAPSYTHDLSTFALIEATETVGEFVNMISGGTPINNDTDDPIQGSYMASQTGKISAAALMSIGLDYGSGVTVPTDGAIFVWHKFDAGGILDTYANGGVRIVVGADLTNWEAWKVGGVNVAPNPYGGWKNYVVHPGSISYDYQNGSGPGGTYRWAGMACTLTATGPGKGNPHKVDAIRYGRGSSIFEYGDLSNGYCTFAGFAALNDANDATNGYNKWGLIQAIAGGYLYKGKLTLGTASNAVDFRDSNAFILIDDTPKVTANFNTIEVNNASSRVDWTNVIFKALGSTSPGRLVVNANADLNWDACQFFDMGAFTLGGTGSELLNCVWQSCGLITVVGGKLNGSQVLTSTVAADASAVNWNVNVDPDGYLDNMTISKGSNDHHAIEFGTSCPTTMTVRGLTASGFSASDGQNSSTFYIAATGGTVTIYCVGCTGNMTYKSAGATVVIVPDPVTVKVTVKTAGGTEVENARVLVKARNGTGPFPYQETVTIVNSGTTATVTHTGHGMATNDKVLILGASLEENNGVFQITKINDNSYSYTMSSSPGSSPSGTITATFVALEGLTNASGVISTSRVYSSDQPVDGWARKASASPYYKPGPISETVDSTDGMTTTAILIGDE